MSDGTHDYSRLGRGMAKMVARKPTNRSPGKKTGKKVKPVKAWRYTKAEAIEYAYIAAYSEWSGFDVPSFTQNLKKRGYKVVRVAP